MAKIDPDEIKRPLTVGEVARRSGVAVSALHFYETKGLIHSVRSAGQQRRYGRDVLRRVAVIKVAQRIGISLASISEAFASLPEGRSPPAADWARMARQWRTELDERIMQLTRLPDQLDGGIGCGCLSIDACRLRNPLDELSEQGSGPQLL